MTELTREIIDNAYKVLVLCYSDTCNKCHFREKELAKLDLDIWVWKYNAGNDPKFCEEFSITNVPVLIMFENWKVKDMIEEVQPNDYVLSYFQLQ